MGKKINAEYSGKDIMDKLEIIHQDINKLENQVVATNGKVKLHEKILWSLGGVVLIVAITLVNLIFNSK